MIEAMTTDHRRFKDGIYEQLARVGKAVSAPKRVELLDLLCQGPRTVEALAAQASVSVANASRHLQVLRAAGLVVSARRGSFVEYRVPEPAVCAFALSLRGVATARLAEVDRATRAYFDARGDAEPVGGEELMRRVRRGEVTVIDVRPEEEFLAGHIPGARSIPVGALKARLKEIPKGRAVVAYCRGPYCVMAADAVALLRKRGYDARRTDEGVVEWRARGGRVEVGAAEAAS